MYLTDCSVEKIIESKSQKSVKTKNRKIMLLSKYAVCNVKIKIYERPRR